MDFLVVVTLPESGPLLVVVVVSEDFSETSGLAAAPGAPAAPWAPGVPAGPWSSLHPTLKVPARIAITAIAAYLAVVLIIFFVPLSSVI